MSVGSSCPLVVQNATNRGKSCRFARFRSAVNHDDCDMFVERGRTSNDDFERSFSLEIDARRGRCQCYFMIYFADVRRYRSRRVGGIPDGSLATERRLAGGDRQRGPWFLWLRMRSEIDGG